MTTFTIDADHNITAYANAEEAKQGDAAGVIFQGDSSERCHPRRHPRA